MTTVLSNDSSGVLSMGLLSVTDDIGATAVCKNQNAVTQTKPVDVRHHGIMVHLKGHVRSKGIGCDFFTQ